MTDHADTIRRAINEGGRSYKTRSEGRLALDALVAERQQAIDERDALRALVQPTTTGTTAHLCTQLQQAIDALREIRSINSGTSKYPGKYVHDLCDSALLSLGEQP